MAENPVVGIIMGSDSDLPCMQAAAEICEQFKVPYEITIVSAHRTPQRRDSRRASVSSPRGSSSSAESVHEPARACGKVRAGGGRDPRPRARALRGGRGDAAGPRLPRRHLPPAAARRRQDRRAPLAHRRADGPARPADARPARGQRDSQGGRWCGRRPSSSPSPSPSPSPLPSPSPSP